MPRSVLLLLVANLVLIGVLVQIQNKNLNQRVLALQTSRQAEINELNQLRTHWEKIVSDSPTYRDGYLQLAAIEYKLQNPLVAKHYLGKVLDIDPNFELPITLSFLQPLVSQR